MRVLIVISPAIHLSQVGNLVQLGLLQLRVRGLRRKRPSLRYISSRSRKPAEPRHFGEVLVGMSHAASSEHGAQQEESRVG